MRFAASSGIVGLIWLFEASYVRQHVHWSPGTKSMQTVKLLYGSACLQFPTSRLSGNAANAKWQW